MTSNHAFQTTFRRGWGEAPSCQAQGGHSTFFPRGSTSLTKAYLWDGELQSHKEEVSSKALEKMHDIGGRATPGTGEFNGRGQSH